jgi:4'-phosphopantetheinyl transferase EntD
MVTSLVQETSGALLPEELAHTERMVAKRLREFTAGRVCARAALAQLGYDAVAIGVGAQREPLWPTGVVGSIAHSNALAAAVVSTDPAILGLGLDLEPDEDLPAEVLERVCRPEERAWLETQPDAERLRLARTFFSAKEAFFKCVFPRARTWLEFEDVRVDVDARGAGFEAHVLVPSTSAEPLPPMLGGRIAYERGHVWTAVAWLAP